METGYTNELQLDLQQNWFKRWPELSPVQELYQFDQAESGDSERTRPWEPSYLTDLYINTRKRRSQGTLTMDCFLRPYQGIMATSPQ
jgi:hypothetical protein